MQRACERIDVYTAGRKAALAVHLAVSVGWIGAVATYLGMGLIAGWVIVPLAVASLLTGLVVSLGTKWACCATGGCSSLGR